MTLPNFDAEVQELLEILTRYGYRPFELRAANKPDVPEINVVAFRSGEVRFIQVVMLAAGNSKKKVMDEAMALDAMVNALRPLMHTTDFDVNGFFAVKSMPSDKWLYAERDSTRISFGEDYHDLVDML